MDEYTKLLAFLAAVSGSVLEKMDSSNDYWDAIYKTNDYAWDSYPKDKMSASEFYEAIKNAEKVLGL